ncbi:MAG: methyltransferase [Waddliaceae bacterium]
MVNKDVLRENLIFILSHSSKITYSLYLAYELDLFDHVSKNEPISLEKLSILIKINTRSIQALVSMCSSIGLLENISNRYRLTVLSRCFLEKNSKYYIGDLLSLNLSNKDVTLSYESFRQAILTGSPQVYNGKDLFQTNTKEAKKNEDFTRAMHARSTAAAEFWPLVIDFSEHNIFLDIGGGSGVHAIYAVRKWSNLKAIVYERHDVCEIAQVFIAKENLSTQVSTFVGDMWSDPFPKADIHFYCDIFHDWTLERVEFLLKKSFYFLPEKGKIVIHELLFDDNKEGPLSVSMSNLSMLIWTEGQQLSKNELYNLLRKTGFKNISILNTGFGDWSITVAEKRKEDPRI